MVGFQVAVLSPVTAVAENAVRVLVSSTAWAGPAWPGTRVAVPVRCKTGPDQ
jgi:hypothetical protein